MRLSRTWLFDPMTEHSTVLHRIKRHVLSARTKFQEVELVETEHLGLVLILDGKIQSAELDEHIYHEALVHPVMVAHPKPERVLILGGGEGATLREVLKHPAVKRALMVDLDGELVELCREHLRTWHMGAFGDRRTKLVIGDALKFVMKTKEKFDIVVVDISDPIKDGPARQLYTREFYGRLGNILRPGGAFVTQAVEATAGYEDAHAIIHRTAAAVFPVVDSYIEHVPSFTCMWGFVAGSSGSSLKDADPMEITKRLRGRKIRTRFYDAETHARMTALPPSLRRKISRTRKISTKSDPLGVFDF